jgi:cytochrome c-type biogenesis protein CcmH/NrfG
MSPKDQSVKPSKAVHARRRVPRESDSAPNTPVDRFKVIYLVVSSLVVCSMLAVALATIDFGGLFSDGDSDRNIENPNSDLIAEQEAVVAENPNDVDQIVLLANLLGNTGQIQQAIPWYEKALSLTPEDHGIRLDFARSLAGADLQTDAEAQFIRVLENDPDNQTAHYYLAELYMAWAPPERDEATEHYERAVALDPESFLGQRAKIQLDSLNSPSPATTPASTPEVQGP